MWKQLEERRIAQWAIGYLAGCWIALQVFELLWDVFEWPLAPLRIIIGLIGLGFFITLGAAWARPRKIGGAVPRATSPGHARLVPAFSIVLALVLFVGVGFAVKRSLDRSWAAGAAVLEVESLASAEAYGPALEILDRALGYLPDNPDLLALLEEVSASPILETIPAGASVYTRDYEGVEEWTLVGETPITGVRVPRRLTRWRIVKDGFSEMEIVGPPGGPTSVRPGAPVLPLTLVESGSVPEDMIPVPGSNGVTFITGIDPLAQRDLSPFFIDRHEVTNEAFQQFVDDGGYERPEFWKEPFLLDGRVLSFEQAMDRFRDVTGRPGPAGWEVGRFRAGEERHPVGGVSWYEAAAYAEFVGKSLPTIHHWTAAAGPNLAAAVISGSNFGSAATVPVGQTPGLSAWGASDMAGNVREWLWTASGDMRHNLGGGWSDNTYFFTFANVQSPWDRLPVNGFRLAVYPEGADLDDPAWAPEPLLSRNYAEEEPVADAIFEVYRAQFDYDPAPLDVRIEREVELSYGTGQVVSYEGVGWGRIQAVVLLPADTDPPYQTVVYYPASNAIRVPEASPENMSGLLGNLVRSGRAVILPILRGTFQRQDGVASTWPNETRAYVDYVRSWVVEFRRSIDYLESRPEIDVGKLAYYGTSWGGRMGAIIAAVEPRLSTAILWSGGLASGSSLPEVDQINYVTRVTMPVLMLNGPFDSIEPVEEAQLPMYRLLGTPPEHKRRVEIPGAGHALPDIPVTRESLAWLDQYLGPVD